MITPSVIDNTAAFDQCCEKLAESPWLALDTEFVRERTYYPKLCLIQVAVPGHIYCIDPLAIDELASLMRIIVRDSKLKIFHSARQDLEILFGLVGDVPRPIFDTQIAASLIGFPDQVGYGALVENLCGAKLDKSQTRTDWMRRPLSPPQIEYAAADVRYLEPMREKLSRRLEAANRIEWLEQEIQGLYSPALYQIDPGQAWRRVKGISSLTGLSLSVAQDLARWREHTAQRDDLPRGWVLRDDGLLKLAQLRPASVTELAAIERISSTFIRHYGDDVVACLAGAGADPVMDNVPGRAKLSPAGRQLVAELSAVVRQRAADADISASVVATRFEIECAVMGISDTRIFSGWREAFIGSEIAARIAAADDVIVAG